MEICWDKLSGKRVEIKQFEDYQMNKNILHQLKICLNREVFESIYQKKQMRYLKVINVLGITSIIVILSLTLLGFFNLLTSLIYQRENFKYINWIYMINVQISYSLSENNIFVLNRSDFQKTPVAQQQLFTDLLNEQQKSRIHLSKEYINLLYNNTNKDIEVFKIIQNVQIAQNIYSSYDISQQLNLSMIYSILLQIFGIYFFVQDLDPSGIIKKQNSINYPALNQQVQTVFSQMNNNYQNQLKSIQDQTLAQLFVITLIMFLFLLSIIPSYIFAKKKQEKILKLFGTFDSKQLKEILEQIQNQLIIYSLDSKLNVQQNNHFSEKKFSISQTSHLKYSLKNLLIGLLMIFCLSIIYPISNYLNVTHFIDSSTTIYNFNKHFKNNLLLFLFKDAVCISYFAVLNSLRARQGLAMAFLMPQQQSIPIITYQTILNQLTIQANELPNLIKENLQQVSSKNLHNQQIFDDFLINIFTQNACETIQRYNQYQNGDFLFDQCETVGRGSLQQGLLNGIINFFSTYKDFLSFAFTKNSTEFQQNFNSYNNNIPAYKQFQFKIELSKEFEYLLNFFQDQNKQLYDYYENLSIILVALQICFVLIFLTASWFYYFKRINDQIFSTKQFLNIFSHQYLIENTYIITFLNYHD